jgi:hypothetical protein
MKKIFVSILVLAMASGASAAVIGVQTGGSSTADVNSGDTITVDIVTVSGFSGAMGSWLAQIEMDIIENNSDVDAPNVGTLNPSLPGSPGVPGLPHNLITGIVGGPGGGLQNGAIIYSFDLKVSDTAGAGTATIDLANLLVKSPFATPITTTVNTLVLTITPVCCPGDSDNDLDYDLDDHYALQGALAYADFILSGGAGTHYIITPDDPNVNFLWNPCLDLAQEQESDDYMDIMDLSDYYVLKGNLAYADWILSSGAGTHYIITPDDPNVGFLWECQ